MRDANYYRRELGDLLFQYYYNVQVSARYLSEYNMIRNAGIQIQNLYSLNSMLYLFSVQTPGPWVHEGTWRRDYKIALEELHKLAENGPSVIIIMAITYFLSSKYSENESYSGYYY